MISRLSGTVVEIDMSSVTLDVQGVGYLVHSSSALIASLEIGSAAVITVWTEVKEDAIRLFGFADKLEKQVFILLTLVKGVGAKTALDIVSKVDSRELLRLIASGELTKLQAVKGIGRKTAERIIVELRDKVGTFVTEHHAMSPVITHDASGADEDAIAALQALGFPRRDAERAVQQVDRALLGSNLDAGLLVREALRFV